MSTGLIQSLRGVTRMTPALVLVSLLGCSNLLPAKGRVTEFKSTTVPNVTYKTVAVIASDDTNNAIRMSASVRSQLTESGITGVKRSGRWDSEDAAVNEICRNPGPEGLVQGVVIVSYDTLVLRECESKLVHYKVVGGGRLALNQLADKLIGFIRAPGTGQS